MRRCCPAVLVALIVLAQTGAASDLSDERLSEQQELLAWVRALQRQGRDEQALRLCEMILEADPACARALVEQGILRLAGGQREAARDDFSTALGLVRDMPMALVGRAHAHFALGDTDAGRRDAGRAIDVCGSIIEEMPTDAEAYYVRGLARALMEQSGTLHDFVTAADLDETLVEARIERARIYQTRGRLEDALEQLTEAVEVVPDFAVGYLARAHIRFEMKDFEASVRDCDRALEINPGFARAWHNRGLVNLQIGELQAAIDDFGRAIELKGDYASAHYYRGEAYYRGGSRAAARGEWETAKELDPDGWAGKTAAEMLRGIESGEL